MHYAYLLSSAFRRVAARSLSPRWGASFVGLLLLMGSLPSSAQTKLYWAQSSGTAADDRLSSANLDGSGRLDLASGNGSFDNPQALAVDVANNRVYVGDGGNAGSTGIRRYNLATGALVDQIVAGTTGISINALQVVGSKLYWVQSSSTATSDQLCSANLDGTGLSVLASGNSATTFLNPQSLWVDAENGFIYVGDGAGASSTGLSRFTLAGSFSATLVAGSAAVSYNGVQKAGSKLYWVQSSGTAADDRLSSANLDGSGRTDLASGNSATTFINPQALWVDAVNSQIYVGDGAGTGSTGISRFTLTGAYVSNVVAGSTVSINAIGSNQQSATAPTLTSLNPTTGPVGTSVTLTGTNFTGTTAVSFNGTAAVSLTVNSATSITATVPAGAATGNVTVTTPGGTSNGLAFTVSSPLLLTGSTPARNAVAGSRSANVSLVFDGPLTPGTAGNVRLFSAQRNGQLVRGGNATASGNTLTVNPAQDLRPGETVFVTVPATVAGSGGNAAKRVYQFTAAAGAGPGTFSGGSDPTVGSGPQSVVAADVDSDGDLDLLAANQVSNTVSVRFNTGSGAFVGATNVAVGNSPYSVVAADVDGDGDLDMLTANASSNTVSVRLNNSNGAFSGSTDVAVGNGSRSVAVADVDGDGDLDLLTANEYSNTVSVRLNDGSGTFSGTTNVAVGTSPFGVAAADVDGDGDLDLLTANASGSTVSVRLNDGSGTFSGTTNVAVGSNPRSVAAADVDGDGDLDILAANSSSNTVSVRLNDGSGTFSGTANVAVGSFPTSVVAADVDGDGDLDILAANTGTTTVSVRLNNGSGTFSGSTDAAAGGAPASLVAADVDGDGDLDLLTTNSPGSVSVRLNQVAAPTLTSLNPTTGPVGTSVTLTGTNFVGTTGVSFNGTAAASFTVVSATSITATVPTGATTGGVTVTTPSGTSNGVTFIVTAAPTVTTTAPTSITTTGATLGGNVTADGGAFVTERGVVYVAGSGTPTTSDTKVVIGSGTGSFALAVTGLTAGTQYTTRAYATNSAGTSYGTSQTFTTTAPLTASISAQTNVLCFGGTTGAATVTVSGGTAPYTYSWNTTPAQTTATATGLAAGSYTVTITDAASRTSTAQAVITQPASALTSSVTVTNVACFGGNTGAINLTPAGGTAPYTFAWGGGISTEDRTNLAAGTYSVTITDANGCTRTQSATISQPATALNVSLSKTDATANGAADGTATATPAGGTPGYTYLWSNGQTTATATSLPAGTYSVTVTDANNCQVTSGSVVVSQPTPAPQNLTISTGTPAAPVAIAAGTYNNITITGTGVAQLSGAVTVNGTFSVAGSLDTNCQSLTGPGSFTLADQATLLICDLNGIAASGSSGAVQLTGTRSFSPGASYVYNNLTPNTPQITGSGLPSQVRNLTTTSASNTSSFSISRPVAIREVYDVAGNVGGVFSSGITLLSDASGTALVNMGSTRPADTYTVQRYIDPTTNAGVGYRHIAMLPSSATVASYLGSGGTTPVFNTAYNTSATPLSTTPFPTVFGYDQARLATSPATGLSPFDKGWFSPAGTETVVGRSPRPTAYTVQLPGASTLSFLTNDRTSFTYSLARNSGATAADAGWNFVANPFLAPLDWSTVPASQRTNVDAAMYVFESTSQYGGQYRSYANGIGASPLIGLAQGFWVRVSEGQTSGSLNLLTANRVTTYNQQAPVRRGAADSRPQLQLQLAGASGPADDLFVYAQAGATAGLDAEFDAAKLPNSSGLNLASLTAAGELLAIDGRPAFGSAAATSIPLSVAVPQAGTYTFTAAALHNLPVGTRAELVDNLTGTRTVLAAGTRYAFSLSTTTAPGRFSLNLAPAGVLSSGAAALAAQVSVFPNPSTGLVTVLRPATGTASAEVLNALGQVVRRVALPTAETRLDLRELPTGIYTLRLTTPQGTVSKRLVRE